MATRYFEQATQQLAPVYDQQVQQLQSQIPAIQNLYQTLTQGLQQQNQMQLDAGVQNITEDASARGVLRSTLPVDARMNLTAQLGAALNQGLGQLGMQQAKDVGGITQQIGGLQVNRANAIADLSRALESQDLERQKFEHQKQMDAQQLALERQKVAASRASAAAVAQGAPKSLVTGIRTAFERGKGKDGFVSPQLYRDGLIGWVNEGGSPNSYHETFGWAVNPVHQERFGGYY